LTVSLDRRNEYIKKALLMMAGEIGDDYCYGWVFPVKDHSDILPTTWRELEDQGLVRPMHTFGNPQFQLTEHGWREAVVVSGQVADAAMIARAVRLVQALKALVDGRNQIHDSRADERDMSVQTGLPAGWIHNAIKSGLLQQMFPKDMMNAYFDAPGRCFRVPPTFGMDWRR
jgi:hypothetical protein